MQRGRRRSDLYLVEDYAIAPLAEYFAVAGWGGPGFWHSAAAQLGG
jgi:hypothetical protein